MFDRNTIIALVIIGLLLLLTPYYYKLVNPPQPETQKPAVAPVPTETPPEKAEEAKTEVIPPSATAPTLLPTASEVNPDFVKVETPLYRLAVGSNGQVTSYQLKRYKTKGGDPVTLTTKVGAAGKVIGGFDLDFGTQILESLGQSQFEKVRDVQQVIGQPDSVILRTGNDSIGLTLVYIFYPNRYGFDVAVETRGFTPPSQQEYRMKWLGGVPTTEPDTILDLGYNQAYAYVGDVLEKVKLGGKESKDFEANGETHFAAARSKYFIAAIIPQKVADGVEIHGRRPNPRLDPKGQILYDVALRKQWNGSGHDRYTIYWGPIDYGRLRATYAGLEKTMDWGWSIIKPFSMAILWALKWLGGMIPNYGAVIIVFSILIKMVLWPLTRKSQISMKKMAALQPEIQAMREKHKANPQALNKAIMALYKEKGVNPASGCIPLLFQMPVLYGLFIVFRSTIEFRQAPFILWITDLSRPDYVAQLPFAIPLYGASVAILPLIMGATQFIMSLKTVTDPNQKMMAYIMPIFMTLIFNQFPSGLTLYYTLYNVWALLEQRFIKLPTM